MKTATISRSLAANADTYFVGDGAELIPRGSYLQRRRQRAEIRRSGQGLPQSMPQPIKADRVSTQRVDETSDQIQYLDLSLDVESLIEALRQGVVCVENIRVSDPVMKATLDDCLLRSLEAAS